MRIASPSITALVLFSSAADARLGGDDDYLQKDNSGFALTFSSDPQYIWYDDVNPQGLTTDDEIKGNSARQIRQQYADMNKLADERWKEGKTSVQGAIITGDLTAAGHPEQIDFMTNSLQTLAMNSYPSLGSRDYFDNVDSFRDDNWGANHMVSRFAFLSVELNLPIKFSSFFCDTQVKWMYEWLGLNHDILNLTSYDMFHRSYYLFPDFRTDFYGSASYSFNINNVHFLQLQNYPTYVNQWNGWDDTKHAYRNYVYIKSSMSWLENDLAKARNRGDSIIVCLHDYVDKFQGAAKATFERIMEKYQVSAIFGGHIHDQIGMPSNSTNATSNIPFFFAGSSTYQQYLVADFDIQNNVLQVQGRRDRHSNGDYEDVPELSWKVPLDNTLPPSPLPVPPVRGHVTFYCDGGFVAVGELKYTLRNGETESKTTSNLALGNMQVFDIPGDATNISIKGSYVLFGNHKIFQVTVDKPPNNCYRMFGTAIKRHWDNSCGRNALNWRLIEDTKTISATA